MKPQRLIIALIFVASAAVAAEDAPPELYVPDGQLLAAPVKMFVSPINMDVNMKPRLQLAAFKARNHTNISRLKEWEPFIVAPNQTWMEKVGDQSVQRRGTLLIFDLSQFKIDAYKSAARVTPVLTWQPPALQEGNQKPMLVGQAVYLGRRGVAAGWTALAVAALVGVITCMASKAIKHKKSAGVFYLLSGPDNYMSLWRTQLAAWTIAIGSMVFMLGIFNSMSHVSRSRLWS